MILRIKYLVRASYCKELAEREERLQVTRGGQKDSRGGQKGVVYCRTKDQGQDIAKGLGCGFYYADTADRERVRIWVQSGVHGSNSSGPGQQTGSTWWARTADWQGWQHLSRLGWWRQQMR